MEKMLNIPVQATYRIINDDLVMVAAEYREISADMVAQFLIEKVGMHAIFGEGVNDYDTPRNIT